MKDQLTTALQTKGFRITRDPILPLLATKTYETACGPKEASICIFPSTPNRVDATYYSEGRNILETESFQFTVDPLRAIERCEALIEQSYARHLWHLGVRSADLPSRSPTTSSGTLTTNTPNRSR